MPSFRKFSFINLNAIWGIIEFEEWAEADDCISIELEADQFTDSSGAKGDVVRVQTNDSRCTIIAKLLQTSITNSFLYTEYNIDRELGNNVKPFVVEDKELGEIHTVNNAWIRKPPTIIRGRNANIMEWTLRGDFLTSVITT